MNRSESRQLAVQKANSRKNRIFSRPQAADGNYLNTSEYFGCHTFSFDALAERLSTEDVARLKEFAISDLHLSIEIADKVAAAAKEWAISKGATHYCHWFQPQTGATAEKHDSFFSFDQYGRPVESFTGKQLIQTEPDASSFPSGGRRSTFEARGYTVWDASSPMFLRETENGMTLCIPSLFVSYTGEALDKKTPLLRSIKAVSGVATKSLHLMGESEVKYVTATAGPEQEYFVVDKALHCLRPDLILAGRTLIGRVPPKGQQLEDHYFGTIKDRLLNFIIESEHELYKLGVPCKTRHNEVAPSQLETAPIFELANVAADHNQMVMEVIRDVALRHDLVALFHEKPYQEMNGSGKHVNWSLTDSNGSNLLEPGDNPHENLRFLYFLSAAVKAIHDYGSLMRVSVASPGNDFRLGANEAPPAIMSAYLGETLTEVLDRICGDGDLSHRSSEINLDLAKVPVVTRDNTDRNRTSPFAFTGNKFEFRAVGSSASISPALTYLNTAVAQALTEMNQKLVERLRQEGVNADDAVLSVIKDTVLETKNVRFEGNNYASDWHEEAKRRGLPNLPDTPSALQSLSDEKVRSLFVQHQVLSEDELDARRRIQLERYNKIRLIELQTLQDLVLTHVLPCAEAQIIVSGQAIESIKSIQGQSHEDHAEDFHQLVAVSARLRREKAELLELCKESELCLDDETLSEILSGKGMELMERVRQSCDTLELLIDDRTWTLPKYTELIYSL